MTYLFCSPALSLSYAVADRSGGGGGGAAAAMLESGTVDTAKQRYAPPPQRNRVLSRRKSGERFDRINFSYGSDAEKNQPSQQIKSYVIDHGEGGNIQNENPYSGMIAIDGCCTSEAAQLLNERWAAAMHSYNDHSRDLFERPTMYSGALGSAWGQLPPQMDFLAELRRAMNGANSGATHVAINRS